MSYLVLARKWRPRRFSELVGQEHVVRALSNALESGKVHHAFLFTGTRGVGKTTIARIFAKSLNCEKGSSAEPCGECAACRDIDDGRYVDLLEIDAASHTGVDNVRDLIDNAQYMPSRGRTKVYLIDEVHMLSKPAFNALLKTLEEPPAHVKFLLATTDPQKLPVTVLSRCLQFNLRRLDEAQIGGQITRILEAEAIPAEAAAISLLARAADGSLRDGLSLLDQAIAYTGGKLDEAAVIAMLGTVDRSQIGALLEALAAGDGAALLARIDELASYSPDFGHVLEDLAMALHRIQLRQMVPGMADEAGQLEVAEFARHLSPELVQLWYQMAVTGRRDLGLAPSQRTGFEMSLLRMLAFRPSGQGDAGIALPSAGAARSTGSTATAAPAAAQPAPSTRKAAPAAATSTATPDSRPASAAQPASASAPSPVPSAASLPLAGDTSSATRTLASVEDWLSLVAGAGLKGPVRELAAHSAFCGHADGVLQLSLPDSFDHLRSDNLVRQLAQSLAPALGAAPKIRFESAKAAVNETLHSRSERQRDQRQADAESAFLSDPVVSRLVQQGATVVPDSVRPLDEH